MPAVEFDQKVNVAPFGNEFAARCRTEKIEAPNMKAATQRPQFLEVQQDLVNHEWLRFEMRKYSAPQRVPLTQPSVGGLTSACWPSRVTVWSKPAHCSRSRRFICIEESRITPAASSASDSVTPAAHRSNPRFRFAKIS